MTSNSGLCSVFWKEQVFSMGAPRRIELVFTSYFTCSCQVYLSRVCYTSTSGCIPICKWLRTHTVLGYISPYSTGSFYGYHSVRNQDAHHKILIRTQKSPFSWICTISRIFFQFWYRLGDHRIYYFPARCRPLGLGCQWPDLSGGVSPILGCMFS